jgi:hypothetical protein
MPANILIKILPVTHPDCLLQLTEWQWFIPPVSEMVLDNTFELGGSLDFTVAPSRRP